MNLTVNSNSYPDVFSVPFPRGAGAHHQNYPELKVEMDQAHPTQSADQHPPSLHGLEPPEEAEKKKTSSDEEKNSAGKNVYLSLLFIKLRVFQSFYLDSYSSQTTVRN